MTWFSGLGSKIKNGVSSIGQKLANGATWLGDKVGKYGDMVSKVAEKVAPLAAVINPAIGETIAGIGMGATVAANAGRAVSSTVRAARNGEMTNRLG